jgi:hypothetical protein
MIFSRDFFFALDNIYIYIYNIPILGSSIAMKYILVTGGVISGIGKGIIASSIGTILRSYGIRVTSIKVTKRKEKELNGENFPFRLIRI